MLCDAAFAMACYSRRHQAEALVSAIFAFRKTSVSFSPGTPELLLLWRRRATRGAGFRPGSRYNNIVEVHRHDA